jgi:hypothetical protein
MSALHLTRTLTKQEFAQLLQRAAEREVLPGARLQAGSWMRQ